MNRFHDIGQGELHDTQFMSADEKGKVLKDWERFLQSGCAREKFTKALYNHLIMHCSFIAHYDINGFFSTYFVDGDDTVHFLSQFDDSKGMPRSAEIGMTYWLTGDEYHDINSEMVRIAGKYIPVLTKQAETRQKAADINMAKLLLAKHGINLPGEDDGG